MNQSTVPHEEIGVRLSICCEFLSDEKKPIEEAYESLMEKIGRKIMEYSEFEYWFKRFQNNQFDLGYDTSLDSKEISEFPNTTDSEANGVEDDLELLLVEQDDTVEVLEQKMEDWELDHQVATESIKRIQISLNPNSSTIFFGDTKIQFDTDPEKSIIDYLGSALEDPNLRLNSFEMENNGAKIDFENLKFLLQSMLEPIHSIHTSKFYLTGFDEDIFISLLGKMEPGTLETISFDISWKNEGKCRKTREIIEMEQWKQAKIIHSYGVTSLKIGDILHCESFTLNCNCITPRHVVRLREYLLNSFSPSSTKCSSGKFLIKNESLNINEFKLTLGPKHRDSHRPHSVSYRYPLPDGKVLCLNINPNMIDFWRI